MSDLVMHNEFEDAMDHIQKTLSELNPRRRFVFVLMEDKGPEGIKVSRSTWNFPVSKYREALSALRDNFVNDVIPPMPEPLPSAEEDWAQEGVAEDAGCDVPSSQGVELDANT